MIEFTIIKYRRKSDVDFIFNLVIWFFAEVFDDSIVFVIFIEEVLLISQIASVETFSNKTVSYKIEYPWSDLMGFFYCISLQNFTIPPKVTYILHIIYSINAHI